jgi:hypothetical protein
MVIMNIQKRQNIDYFHTYGNIARMYELVDLYGENSHLTIIIMPVNWGSNPFPCTVYHTHWYEV